MFIYNPLAVDLVQEFDSVAFHFPARQLVEVEQICGLHCLQKLARRGLRQWLPGKDLKALEIEGLTQAVTFLERQILSHENQNIEQEQRKLPLLVEPAGVKECRQLLPIYKKQLAAIGAAVAEKEKTDLAARAEALFGTPAEIPKTADDFQLEELLAYAEEHGIKVKKNATKEDLLTAIAKQRQ